MLYRGSCHCGHVGFEVEGTLDGAMACNCSICQRKGSLLAFMPYSKLKWIAGENAMSSYTFNKHVIKHRFCPTCGIHPYGEGKDRSGNEIAAVNIRCIEGLDLLKIEVQEFDGRAL